MIDFWPNIMFVLRIVAWVLIGQFVFVVGAFIWLMWLNRKERDRWRPR